MPAHPAFALDGKVALVSGGSRGIGRAIALALAASGASVAVFSRKREACDAVVAEIAAAGGQGLAVAGHAGRLEDIERAVAAVMERWGRLDILVNNAATNPQFAAMVDMQESAVDKTFEVNFKGPWLSSRAAVRAAMGDHGGSIINIVSIDALHPSPYMGAYSASKAALISLTKTLAQELGPRVRVNAVAPGLVRTDFARVLVETDELRERFIAGSALARVGEPDEIAGAVVWLAGDASAFVTGSVVVVDGGSTA